MVILGIRSPENEKRVCRCYDADQEYCTIDCLLFNDVRTALIRKTGAQPPITLCASFTDDITIFPGVIREVMDVETGLRVGTLAMRNGREACFNERYLFRKKDQTVHIWDLTRRGDPIAAFNLDPLGQEKRTESVNRFVFLCEDTLPETLRLAFLLYPHMCFL